MTLTALVVVPFVAWHAYRAIRALRTGVFKSFGSDLNRASVPDLFWFRVVREVLVVSPFLWKIESAPSGRRDHSMM
jgi:hypothetical protein